MIYKKNLILVFLLFFVQYSFGQNRDSTNKSNYFTKSKQQFTFYISVSRFLNGFYYNTDYPYHFKPSVPINLGVGFSYRILYVEVSFMSFYLNKNVSFKPRNIGMQAIVYTKRFGIDFLYHFNNGYFLDQNSKEQVLKLTNQYPSDSLRIASNRFSLNLITILGKNKYALNRSLAHLQFDNKKSFSWLINTSFSRYFINNEQLPLPIDTLITHSNYLYIKKATIFSISPMFGFGLHYVWKGRFYLGILPAIGPSFQFATTHSNQNDQNSDFHLGYKFIGRIGMGYHTQRWVFSSNIIIDSELYNLGSNTYIINGLGRLTFRIGYKINRKKQSKVDDIMNSIEHMENTILK
jgi:hypothetical protein